MDSCEKHHNDPKFKEMLRIIGDFWALRIVSALEEQDLRFCAIERALGDSNPATLTARLKKLEQYDIVSRRKEGVDTVYSLTDRGAKLFPIVRQLQDFALAND